MRIVICWTHYSGYMAACWRALAARPGVELSVIAWTLDSGWQASFDPAVLGGLDCRLLSAAERGDVHKITDLVVEKHPKVLVLPGWAHRPYRILAADPALAHVRRVMTMD